MTGLVGLIVGLAVVVGLAVIVVVAHPDERDGKTSALSRALALEYQFSSKHTESVVSAVFAPLLPPTKKLSKPSAEAPESVQYVRFSGDSRSTAWGRQPVSGAQKVVETSSGATIA